MPRPVEHSAYTLLGESDLPIWNAVGWTYRHQTGARVVSIVTPDDNKTFGIVFPTPPTDHTGLPHILEHCVLCGSRRFPVKEPFKEMLKTSLQTFLNAFTYPDRTCYPVASRNLRDFYNLMDVYLDAVFFPRLTPAVLGQEGWRAQWTQDGALEIQGVVYNEMKGVYASPDSRLAEYVQRHLYPDTIYRFDSGGDPAHIPELTFETFLSFHRRYYQPANALVGFYGNDDPLARLERLDEVLSQVPAGPAAPQISLQSPWASTRREEARYPAEAGNDEGTFCQLTWLLPDETLTPFDRQMTGLSGHLLLNTAASPLRLALLESGLGDDLLGGAQQYLQQPAFGAGLRGVEPGDEEEVFELLRNTLQQLARDNFRSGLLEGSLQQSEFNMREMNSTAKGLHAILTAITPWMYGGDPLDALRPETRLAEVRKRLEQNPRLFADWIQEKLLDNPSQLEMILRPDSELGQEEAREEAGRIDVLAEELDRNPARKAEVETLVQEVDAFQQIPDAPEDIATLPRLRIGDMSPLPPHPPVELDRVHGIELTTSAVETNEILYLRLAFTIRHLPVEDLCLLPLYSRCLTELGTANRDHLTFNEDAACLSGGISVDFETAETYRPEGELAVMMLHTKALANRAGAWFDLLEDMLTDCLLGPAERIHHLLLEERAGEESQLIHAGNQVVSQYLRALMSPMERASEELDGSAYLLALRQLESLPKETVQARLRNLHERLIHREGLRVHLGGTPSAVQQARPALEAFLASLPEGNSQPDADWSVMSASTPYAYGLQVPSPVNFVGLGTQLPLEGPATHYSHFVARRLLNNDYLWEQVRMRGGAYGCSSTFSHLDGRFIFSSYRDPQLDQTLDIYRNAGHWLQHLSLDPDMLEQAKIGTLGKMDPPEKPGSLVAKSFFRHLIGLTYEQRQIFWEEVLETELAHIQAYGAQLQEALDRQQYLCVLGGAEQIKASRESFKTLALM